MCVSKSACKCHQFKTLTVPHSWHCYISVQCIRLFIRSADLKIEATFRPGSVHSKSPTNIHCWSHLHSTIVQNLSQPIHCLQRNECWIPQLEILMGDASNGRDLPILRFAMARLFYPSAWKGSGNTGYHQSPTKLSFQTPLHVYPASQTCVHACPD